MINNTSIVKLIPMRLLRADTRPCNICATILNDCKYVFLKRGLGGHYVSKTVCCSNSTFGDVNTRCCWLAPSGCAGCQQEDVYGRDLPANAAPYDQQIYRELCSATDKAQSFSSVITVYSRICGSDQFGGDSLVNLDENLNIIPGAANRGKHQPMVCHGHSVCAPDRSGAMVHP